MTQFYFKINLNKFGELKRQQNVEKKTFLGAALFYGIGSLIILIFFFVLIGMLGSKLDSRKNLLHKIRKEIKSYQVSGEYLSSNDLEKINDVSSQRIFWAKKLVALSDITTEKLAITKFTFKNNVLSLYGITKIDKDQKEFDLIDKFISDLKANSAINDDFPEIKFMKSSRDKEKDVDILRFQIDCVHPAPIKAKKKRSKK